MIQALLLYVEVANARFFPSGEASGATRLLFVVHNLEVVPSKPT
jgi:hypothetical protein